MTWTEGEQPADEWGQEDGAVGYEAPVESYGGGGGGGDRSCRSCGQEGHFARECPDKKSQACFRCGEEGHRKTECPNQSSRSNGVCRKCNEEGHMARECPNAPPMVCRTCNEEGHSARDCPQGMTCRYCKEEGHMARECPTAPPRVCNKCKEEGHMSRDCPTAGPETCFNCGQEGHRSSDCTNEAVERLGEDGLPLPPPVTYIPPQLEAITDATFDMLHHEEANISRYDTMDVTVSDPQFEVPIYSFAEAGFSEGLMAKIVTKLKFTAPTPIQKFCIPIIAAGRDVIACSQTGSGKSAAFILPILQSIMNDPELPDRESIRGQRTQSPLVVVLSPTRELCVQLYEHFRLFSEENPRRIGVSPAYGGTQVRYNAEQIRSGTHVLCAVPGRLKQFVDDKTISFSKVKFLVLDEADRMLDHGFQDAIKAFHEHETMVPKTNRQTLMFSATFSEVEDLARQMMKPDAVKVVVGILGGVNSDVEQSFVETPDVKAKREKLKSILADIPGSSTGEAENMQPGAGGKVMVFVERKNAADILGAFLSSSGFSATTMHGDRDQQQREEALRTFRNGKHAILVATEVAARGLDIKGLGMVINFDMPQDIDKYVHRVGRTGRVGTAGKAVSFFDPAKDSQIAPHLVKVLNECGQAVPDFISNAASGYSADDFGGGDAGGDGDGWGNGEDEWGS